MRISKLLVGLALLGAAVTTTTTEALSFDKAFGDHMVLQQAPSNAAVFGTFSNAPPLNAKVRVAVATVASSYIVDAVVHGNTWKALLRPTASSGVSKVYTLTATCSGCAEGEVDAKVTDVVFGDVW